jgi:hypothetical protein
MSRFPTFVSVLRWTSIVDAADATPGDGVCATSAGVCTLRAATQETNAFPEVP